MRRAALCACALPMASAMSIGLPAVPGALVPRPQVAVCVPQVGKGHGFPVAVADLRSMASACSYSSMARGDLAELGVAVAEVAQVEASPARSPVSRSMASACSYNSMARSDLAEIGVADGEVAQVGGLARRSPVSRAMASACSYNSMARAIWPSSA